MIGFAVGAISFAVVDAVVGYIATSAANSGQYGDVTDIIIPTRRPTSMPTRTHAPTVYRSQVIPVGTMYQDPSSGTVYSIDTTTQYTEYKADGTCTSLPYYVINTNIYMKLTGSTLYTMSGSKLTGVDLASNATSVFNIVTSNPNAVKCDSTKSNYNTYSNIVDIFNVGDIYHSTTKSAAYL